MSSRGAGRAGGFEERAGSPGTGGSPRPGGPAGADKEAEHLTLADAMPASERATIAARYALGLAVIFFLGIMNRWLMNGTTITEADVLGGLYATLLLVNPVASLVVGALLGYKHGLIWIFVPLAGIAFVPATFWVYNPSALPYAIGYMVFAAAGLVAGRAIDRRRRR